MAGVEMKRAAARWAFACWFAWWGAWAAEKLSDSAEWLRKMAEAVQNLNYRVTLAYSRDNRIQALRLVHEVKEGVVREHLKTLSDPLREVVREANQVTCYFPEQHTLRVESRSLGHSVFGEWPTQWQEKAKFYRLALGRRERVAERLAQEIVIEPLDAYRYGRRLWIDEESQLPLKLELIGPKDQVLESLVVTELVLGQVDGTPAQSEAKPAEEGWKVLKPEEAPADQRWQLTQLPPGFAEVKRTQRKDPLSSTPVDHILVTDGLASVSVYIKRQDGGSELDLKHRRLGALNVYHRRIDGYLVTVVGDVPFETVRFIGDGVR
jgi:sigma-E factor negative regulatory protein RseB